MADWIPSLNSLRAFEAVARNGSYRRAATELNVTDVAVKQLVVKLEAALGKRLVVRQGRGIALTEAAIAGAGTLEIAMRQIADAVQKMRAQDNRQRLIVSVEASFATTWLVSRLEDFRSRNPGISVLIDSSQRIVDLHRSDVDIAIRYGVRSDPALLVRRLFNDLVYPACSPALAAASAPLTDVGQLARMPLIHWDMAQLPWANATRSWFDWGEWARRLGVKGIDPGKGLRFSDYGMAVQAAISGKGVILASWPILQDPIEAGLLVPLFRESSRSTDIGYDLVTTPEAASRPAVAAFTDWLLDTARQAMASARTPPDGKIPRVDESLPIP